MRRASAGIVCLCAILLTGGARAKPSLSRPSRDEQPAVAAGMLASQRPDLPPQGSPANRWRYSFHQDHWWYYRDGGRWAYWTGRQWLDYEPQSYRRWYLRQKMADYDAELARFNVLMRPYMSSSFSRGYVGGGPLILSQPNWDDGFARPGLPTSTWGGGLFSPRPFSGRLNYGTSIGGYMGNILSGPFGD